MPSLLKGVYEKKPYYYPRNLTICGVDFKYAASGNTRMVYESVDGMYVAKLMPAKSSKHWTQGWIQNEDEAVAIKLLRERLAATEHKLDLQFFFPWRHRFHQYLG